MSGHACMWGVELAQIGHARVAPDAPQALRGEAGPHLKCVFISSGCGTIEMGDARAASPLRAGQVLLLLPGLWHRYAPDAAAGWTVDWVELRGPLVEKVVRDGFLGTANTVITPPGAGELASLFYRLHALVDASDTLCSASAATLAMHLIGRLGEIRDNKRAGAAARVPKIDRARRYLVDHCSERLDTVALARELGLGHAHFRDAFKKQCGMSARSFHLEARFRRASDLLLNTDLPSREIAEQLGYSSAFHFSAAFKTWSGIAPTAWRRQAP